MRALDRAVLVMACLALVFWASSVPDADPLSALITYLTGVGAP